MIRSGILEVGGAGAASQVWRSVNLLIPMIAKAFACYAV
jgi:hypothetical protein